MNNNKNEISNNAVEPKYTNLKESILNDNLVTVNPVYSCDTVEPSKEKRIMNRSKEVRFKRAKKNKEINLEKIHNKVFSHRNLSIKTEKVILNEDCLDYNFFFKAEKNVLKAKTASSSLEQYIQSAKIRKITNESERIRYIIENINTKLNTEEEMEVICKLCKDYNDVFYIEGDVLSYTNLIEHRIPIKPGTAPIATRQKRIVDSQKKELKRQLAELERQGIIEPSFSPWNSPIMVVKKPDGAK